MNINEDFLEAAYPPKIGEDSKCFFCDEDTSRATILLGGGGIARVYECVPCRQKRVQKQVDSGLRPASDLEIENFPENR